MNSIYIQSFIEPFKLGNKVSGIYCIENIINNKVYIGSSSNLRRRYNTHKTKLCCNIHTNKHLQNAVNKYGIENFVFKVIEECAIEDLIVREQYWLDVTQAYITGYNIRTVAESNKGFTFIMPESAKDKLRIYGIERGKSVEFKEFMSKLHKNRKRSDETKIKLSESHKGIIMSKTTREKLRISSTNRTHSEETKQKISKANKGKQYHKIVYTDEVKHKISESKKKKIYKCDLNMNIIEEFDSITEAAFSINLKMSSISKCLKNSKYTAGGYKWKLVVKKSFKHAEY